MGVHTVPHVFHSKLVISALLCGPVYIVNNVSFGLITFTDMCSSPSLVVRIVPLIALPLLFCACHVSRTLCVDSQVLGRTRRVSEMLVYNHQCFVGCLNELMSGPIETHNIRFPLDTKCLQVSSPYWQPMMMPGLTVSATPDLVTILHGIQLLQQRTEHHLPLVVDENIHYRLLKLVESISYAKFERTNVAQQNTSLVWGVAPIQITCHSLLASFFSVLCILVLH